MRHFLLGDPSSGAPAAASRGMRDASRKAILESLPGLAPGSAPGGFGTPAKTVNLPSITNRAHRYRYPTFPAPIQPRRT
jgi:hypothetical protein